MNLFRPILAGSLLLFCALAARAQEPPLREFRGAWIATLKNIDWPSRAGLPPEVQQAELLTLLDTLQAHQINAVIFQVRPAGDAFYNSPYEPWSEWLTGRMGQAPQPFYDPLAFLTEECHRRGMEVHAWFNPFRALTDAGQGRPLDPRHPAARFPDWMIRYGSTLYFDPGNPEARTYVAQVISDVARRYPIEAVHFDDYFYPYRIQGQNFPDSSSFRQYNRLNMSLDDWRRSNTDAFVRQMRDSLLAIRDDLKFGISPFGVWRNRDRDPQGSDSRAGVTSYDDLYADIRKWLRLGWIDYVAPQLYFSVGYPPADYARLLDWWAANSYGRHLYIGHSPYKLAGDPNDRNWENPAQISEQIRLLRARPEVQGSAFFSAKWFAQNPQGWASALSSGLYRYPALPPLMSWLPGAPPASPLPRRQPGSGGKTLSWEPVPRAAYYVVYRSAGTAAPEPKPETWAALIRDGSTAFTDPQGRRFRRYSYRVQAFDALHHGSEASEALSLRRWRH